MDEKRLRRINDARVEERLHCERACHHITVTPFQPNIPEKVITEPYSNRRGDWDPADRLPR